VFGVFKLQVISMTVKQIILGGIQQRHSKLDLEYIDGKNWWIFRDAAAEKLLTIYQTNRFNRIVT
jgi:hypothetical protein